MHRSAAPPARPGADGGRRSGVPPAQKWEPEILLVSKRRSQKWGIPKGRVEPHLSFGELAAKEAFEEAGVVGYISQNSVGMFRAKRRNKDGLSRQLIEVWVYLFEVTETRRKWPEMHKRRTRWASCKVAAQQLNEPLLSDLCHRLAPPVRSSKFFPNAGAFGRPDLFSMDR